MFQKKLARQVLLVTPTGKGPIGRLRNRCRDNSSDLLVPSLSGASKSTNDCWKPWGISNPPRTACPGDHPQRKSSMQWVNEWLVWRMEVGRLKKIDKFNFYNNLPLLSPCVKAGCRYPWWQSIVFAQYTRWPQPRRLQMTAVIYWWVTFQPITIILEQEFPHFLWPCTSSAFR